MTIVAGHQPNYLPWLGFFDKMRQCDIFIIEDTVQFEYHGFTNRNRIKSTSGPVWLTVPVEAGHSRQAIAQIKIANNADRRWRMRHYGTLHANYATALHWKKYRDFFKYVYERTWDSLLELNIFVIKEIMRVLKTDCQLVMASSLDVHGQKDRLLIEQCKKLGAGLYLSGVGAKNYLDPKRFADEGISVAFQDFTYPTYPQLHGPFIPNLSVVDYLLCMEDYDWKSGMTLWEG